MVFVKKLYSGKIYSLFACSDGSDYHFEHFLAELKKDNSKIHRAVVAEIVRLADFGLPDNEEVFRLADEKRSKKLYVLTKGKVLIFSFHCSRTIFILSFCYKTRNLASELDNAILKKEKFKEIENGLLKQRTSTF